MMKQREAKSIKRKEKSYRTTGLTTTKNTIPRNIHTGLASSGAPEISKAAKKSGRVVVKTGVAKVKAVKIIKE